MSDSTNSVASEETREAEKAEVMEKLESATEQRLAEAFGEEGPSTPVSETESAISTPISDVESAVSTPISDVESAESVISEIESAESVASTVKPAEDKKGILDAHYRAAIHQGWSDDDIKTLYKANPALAEKTFAKLLDTTNRLSREFSAIGRAKLQVSKSDAQPEPARKTEPTKPEFKKVDIEKLRKQYDDDAIVDVVAQMQDQIEQLHEEASKRPEPASDPQAQERVIRAKVQEEAAMEQQIGQFFGGSDLKGYNEFYGKVLKNSSDWNNLSIDQKKNRMDVLNMADQIIIGAEAQGRDMSIDDALNLAHLSISEPVREKVIRETIKTKVVKRAKSLTLKPSGKAAVKNDGPKTAQELIDITTERLNNVKW